MEEGRVKMDRRYDWVGPPHKISKIRYIMLRRDPDETEMEKTYREEREELNRWNSNFWERHNTLFDQHKLEFLERKKAEIGPLEHVSANDLSGCYRDFLNLRHAALMAYNKEWYTRNLSLIWPALRVNVVRFMRKLKR